jgi:putative transposase
MPWLEMNPMDQRIRFLEDVRLGRMSMTELCAHAQISRKTGYKWIAREAEDATSCCSRSNQMRRLAAASHQ